MKNKCSKIKGGRKDVKNSSILDESEIDLEELKKYLIKIINTQEDILSNKKYSTNIKRLIKIYDFLTYKN